jgi:hypothetical protein
MRRVLGDTNATGLATRAKPQPGFLSQMAPFITALGSDPKFMKWLSSQLGGGAPAVSPSMSGFNVGSSANDDWWSGQGSDAISDVATDIDWSELGDAGYW